MTSPTLPWLLSFYGRCVRLPVLGGALHRCSKTARALWNRLAAGYLITRYLRSHPSPRLNLGAGGDALAGWLNTDIAPTKWRMPRVDACCPLPFADGAFDLVFSEHMIEHIPLESARLMLLESHRILRPGGRIRIATPDARRLARLLAPPLAPDAEQYLAWSADRLELPGDDTLPARVVNSLYYGHGHRFLFDEPTLKNELLRAGFVSPLRHDPGYSDHPALRDIEQHWKVLGHPANNFETLVIEAVRP